MRELLRTRASVVWLVLIAATGISWSLGGERGFSSDAERVVSIAVLFIAFVKVRLIGLYFMELRHAPTPLRSMFEGYCIVVFGLVVGMYLVA